MMIDLSCLEQIRIGRCRELVDLLVSLDYVAGWWFVFGREAHISQL